jgi:hypothetical protein
MARFQPRRVEVPDLNGKQIFLIIGAIVSVLMVAGPQLTDLFGAGPAKYIASAAGLTNLIINSVVAILTGNIAPEMQLRQIASVPGGQDALVRNVLAMPGIEPLEVNRRASPELAQLAVDPNVDKIAPKPADATAVMKTASDSANQGATI